MKLLDRLSTWLDRIFARYGSFLIVAISLILIALRLAWCPHVKPSLVGSFEAFAHTFMGYLIGLCSAAFGWRIWRAGLPWRWLWIPTLIEVIAFFVLP